MNNTPHPIRVLIADDYPLIRKSLRAILDDVLDIQIVGEAQNGREAQRLIAELCPDLLLLDLPMPETHPAEVAAWVREHHPDTIILVLAEYDHDVYLSHMIEAGVAGYILKSDADGAVIVDAILRAVRGEPLVTKDQIARATAWHKNVGER